MQISQQQSLEEMQSLLQALAQAFGDVPQSVVNLAKIALIKNLASEFDVKSVKFDGAIKMELYKSGEVVDKRLVGVLSKYGASLRFENLPIIRIAKDTSLSKLLDKVIDMFTEARDENLKKEV